MRVVPVAITSALVVLVSLPVSAQQPPLQGHVTAAELAAIVAKQPKDRNGNVTFFQLAPYDVSMEHRVNVPQTASAHDREAELFYVIDGGGTLVTGGTLTNSKRTDAENSTGSGIEGGTSRKLGKGDFVLVPEGVPHWFSAIDGELTLMSLHLPRAAATK